MSKSALVPLSFLVSSRREADNSARRRGIQAPKVYRDGDLWKIRVYRHAINEEGKVYRSRPEFTIGPASGPGKLTEKQAATAAWENILKHLNAYAAVPQSVITLEQFVAQKFQPNCIENLKKAGQEYYGYCLSKILPVLDKVDRHYKRLFGSAALSSLFSAAFDVSKRQNQSVQPTIKVPVGYRFTVRVNRNILFDAPYEPETADSEPFRPEKEPRHRGTYRRSL